MSALEVSYPHFEEFSGDRSRFLSIGKTAYRDFSAGASNHKLSHLLGIQIKKDITGDESFLKTVGTYQPLLLIHSEKSLEGTMLKIGVDETCHCGGTSHTVVSAKSRSVGTDPLSVHNGDDRVVEEVMLLVTRFFSHHVLMSLQNHYRGAFETGSGRHTHHHVANLIGVTLYVVTLCPIHKKRFHFI
jgi:hypothetical protein